MHMQALPDILPIFPLHGVVLLPGGRLPLNIFEPRYLAMVDDVLRGDRRIGMIQSRESSDALYDIGCAGRITAFEETDDGRILITLTGVQRFKIVREMDTQNGYRRAAVDWTPYITDAAADCSNLCVDRAKLCGLLKTYFAMNEMSCEWARIKNVLDYELLTTLSMVCPFTAHEKQQLLEAYDACDRARIFMDLLANATVGHTCTKGSCH